MMLWIYEGIFAVTIIAIAICLYVGRGDSSRLAKTTRFLLITTMISVVFIAAYAAIPTMRLAGIFLSLFYASMDWLLIMFLAYTREYTDFTYRGKYIIYLLHALATADSVALILNCNFGYEFSLQEKEYANWAVVQFPIKSFGLAYYGHLGFCYLLAAAIMVLLLRKFFTASAFYRKKYSIILICFIALLVCDGVSLLVNSPVNFSIIFYGITAILICYFSLNYIPKSLISSMLDLVVKNLNNSVVCYDVNGRLLYVNDAAADVMEGTHHIDTLNQKYRDWKLSNFDSPERRTSWREDMEINGKRVSYDMVAQKIFDDNDRYIGVYFISYDRTIERNEHQRQLLEEAAKSEQRAHFWANISHEIRTPVNSIVGMNEMILRESDQPEIRQYASDIKTSTDTLISIINDVLDFSKVDSGKMDLVLREYKVVHLLKNVYSIIQPRIKEKGLNFQIEVDSYMPSALWGDELRVQQVMINLLTNAVKYTREGTVTMRLYGERRYEEFFLHVEVEDTGIGIRQENIPLLFQAYERIDEAKLHGIQGTGLGINICEQLLTQMDSHLEVESTYGKGSRFSFVIRQPIMEEKPIENCREQITEVASDRHETNLKNLDLRILLVDDNDMNRIVFKALLKKTGILVEDVNSGAKALELVRRESFDMIFLDHLMPELDGVQVLHLMREDDTNINRATPVIMMTANVMEGAAEKFAAEGFDDYLAKPVDPVKLEETIAKWMKKE